MGRLVTLNYFNNRILRKPVVLTGGTFDLLHTGHAEFLKLCKSFGKTLIVQISSDKYVGERKGKFRPIIGERDRAKLISYLEFVDYVFISYTRCENSKVLSTVRPDFLALSEENKDEKMSYLKSNNTDKSLANINIKFIPSKFYSVDLSTTNLVNTIISKNRG